MVYVVDRRRHGSGQDIRHVYAVGMLIGVFDKLEQESGERVYQAMIASADLQKLVETFQHKFRKISLLDDTPVTGENNQPILVSELE